MSPKKSPELDSFRKKIDQLDQRIIDLLNQRTRYALKIGKAKEKLGKAIYSPERESQIYRMLEEKGAKGILPDTALKAIYREIMSASLALEKALTIAYFGPEASFTHLASLSKFGSSVSYFPATSINEVFQEVERERADYGVIPIENSIEGAVNHSLDMFIDSDLKICSEVLFRIQHNLMATTGRMKDIRKIYSHPQVFGQCRQWIEKNLPGAELIETASTTDAAQRARKERGSAAIASKLAAALYGLPVLKEGIQDFSQNVTRFLVISRQIARPTGRDKTSILVSIKDKVGALYEMLLPIRKHAINMTKIESRPSKRKNWEYYFFIDLQGHIDDAKIRKTLADIESKVKFLKILGSYPASTTKET